MFIFFKGNDISQMEFHYFSMDERKGYFSLYQPEGMYPRTLLRCYRINPQSAVQSQLNITRRQHSFMLE